MTDQEAKVFLDNLKICIEEHPIIADWLVEIADRKTEPSGYKMKPVEQTEPQTDNGIGCSKCESRFWCMDRDMPHAVHCNNYGKVEDEPQTDCSWKKGE